MRQLFFLLPLSYSIPQQVPLIHTQTWTTDIGCMKWDEGGVRGAGLDRRGERNKANPSDVCIGDFYAGQSLLLLLYQLLLPFAALPPVVIAAAVVVFAALRAAAICGVACRLHLIHYA